MQKPKNVVQVDTIKYPNFKDHGYRKVSKDREIRSIQNEFKRIEKKNAYQNVDKTKSFDTIDSFNFDIEIEIEYNVELTFEARHFFKVHYSSAWHKKYYYDIDRSQINKYEFNTTNSLFNFIDTKVYFNKENKAKVKAKIKRLIEKILNEDLNLYHNDQFLTTTKPNDIDYLEKSESYEADFEQLGDQN